MQCQRIKLNHVNVPESSVADPGFMKGVVTTYCLAKVFRNCKIEIRTGGGFFLPGAPLDPSMVMISLTRGHVTI